jgi:hypothetical protein
MLDEGRRSSQRGAVHHGALTAAVGEMALLGWYRWIAVVDDKWFFKVS